MASADGADGNDSGGGAAAATAGQRLASTEVTATGPVDWTPEERASYIRKMGLSLPPNCASAIHRFLGEALAEVGLPVPWVVIRDQRRGKAFFANQATRDTSWQHPLDAALRDLADESCKILSLQTHSAGSTSSAQKRDSQVRAVHKAWTQEAKRELSMWVKVPPQPEAGHDREYFYHTETRETRWDNPAEVVYPPWELKLKALAKLVDADYVKNLLALIEEAEGKASGKAKTHESGKKARHSSKSKEERDGSSDAAGNEQKEMKARENESSTSEKPSVAPLSSDGGAAGVGTPAADVSEMETVEGRTPGDGRGGDASCPEGASDGGAEGLGTQSKVAAEDNEGRRRAGEEPADGAPTAVTSTASESLSAQLIREAVQEERDQWKEELARAMEAQSEELRKLSDAQIRCEAAIQAKQDEAVQVSQTAQWEAEKEALQGELRDVREAQARLQEALDEQRANEAKQAANRDQEQSTEEERQALLGELREIREAQSRFQKALREQRASDVTPAGVAPQRRNDEDARDMRAEFAEHLERERERLQAEMQRHLAEVAMQRNVEVIEAARLAAEDISRLALSERAAEVQSELRQVLAEGQCQIQSSIDAEAQAASSAAQEAQKLLEHQGSQQRLEVAEAARKAGELQEASMKKALSTGLSQALATLSQQASELSTSRQRTMSGLLLQNGSCLACGDRGGCSLCKGSSSLQRSLEQSALSGDPLEGLTEVMTEDDDLNSDGTSKGKPLTDVAHPLADGGDDHDDSTCKEVARFEEKARTAEELHASEKGIDKVVKKNTAGTALDRALLTESDDDGEVDDAASKERALKMALDDVSHDAEKPSAHLAVEGACDEDFEGDADLEVTGEDIDDDAASKDRARKALERALDDGAVDDDDAVKGKARTALERALEEDDVNDGSNDVARNAPGGALEDDDGMTVVDEAASKDRARKALERALDDDEVDDGDAIKGKARTALERALEEDDVNDVSSAMARTPPEGALEDDDGITVVDETCKHRARKALERALPGEAEESIACGREVNNSTLGGLSYADATAHEDQVHMTADDMVALKQRSMEEEELRKLMERAMRKQVGELQSASVEDQAEESRELEAEMAICRRVLAAERTQIEDKRDWIDVQCRNALLFEVEMNRLRFEEGVQAQRQLELQQRELDMRQWAELNAERQTLKLKELELGAQTRELQLNYRVAELDALGSNQNGMPSIRPWHHPHKHYSVASSAVTYPSRDLASLEEGSAKILNDATGDLPVIRHHPLGKQRCQSTGALSRRHGEKANGRSLGRGNRTAGCGESSVNASEVAKFFQEHNGKVSRARSGARHEKKEERPLTESRSAATLRKHGRAGADRMPKHHADCLSDPEPKAIAPDLAHIVAGQTWQFHWPEGGRQLSGSRGTTPLLVDSGPGFNAGGRQLSGLRGTTPLLADQGPGFNAGLHDEQHVLRPLSANGAAIAGTGQRGLIAERQRSAGARRY